MSGNYLVTYDLRDMKPSPYEAVREALISNGFYKWMNPSPGKWPHLPNTCNRGIYETIDAADEAFKKSITAAATKIGARIDVEKYVIVRYDDSVIVSNENSDDL